jgi:hypothetical protein
MDEGFVQLLFVLLLMFASLLDVAKRAKRKRPGQTGELPSEDEPPPEVRRPRRGPRERRVPGTPTGAQTGAPTTSQTPGTDAPADRRETADTLVPDDLWAILTGERPPTKEPRPRDPEAEPWSDEEDRWTGEGVPYPREGESTEAETWRPEVTPEELPSTEAPAEVLPEDERRRRPAPWVSVPTESQPRRMPVPAKVATPTPSVPVAPRVVVSAPLALHATRRSPAARYADLLRRGGVDSLRQAVVLREVLDPPIALRGSSSGRKS